jgi:hypothetical protein
MVDTYNNNKKVVILLCLQSAQVVSPSPVS